VRGAIERLVIALGFVAGAVGFAAVAVTLGAAIVLEHVPVLPIALLCVLGGGLVGSVAAAAASQRWWGFVLGLVLGLLVGLGAAGFGRWTISRVADGALAWGVGSFDEAAWAEASTREDGFNARGKMVASLLLTRRLHAQDRATVRALLGRPDCSVDVPGADAWAIGSWTGFQIASDCLVVAYDAGDRATIVRAVRPRAGRAVEPARGTLAQVFATWADARALLSDAMRSQQ
jgi:hypothetical protein